MGLLRAHFSEDQEPGCRHPRDERVQTVAAARELANGTEEEANSNLN